MGPVYMGFWFTSLYVVFGMPFLLTGVLYALAVRFFAPQSVLTALVAAAIAFPSFLDALCWKTGTFEISTRALGPGFWSDPWNVLNVVLGVSWSIARDREAGSSSPLTNGWLILEGATLLHDSSGASPDITAWRDLGMILDDISAPLGQHRPAERNRRPLSVSALIRCAFAAFVVTFAMGHNVE
jgi:hypothetical protein